MQTIKLNTLVRNLSLIAAGAFMATLVVLPITTWAGDEDEDPTPKEAPAATYTLRDSRHALSVFTLVEHDGRRVLALVEEPRLFGRDDDE